MGKRLKVRAHIGGLSGGRGRSRYASYAEFRNATQQSMAEVQKQILSIFDQLEDASEEIMLQALEPTFEKALTWCPVDTGDMRNSGYLEKVGTKGKPKVEIGFAKYGYPDYTVYVHENLAMPHAEPTRAKWLEAAVMEDLDLIDERLQKGYKAFMGF